MPTSTLTRRSFLAGAAALPLLSALPSALPPAQARVMPTLEFDILRKDSTIGVHRIDVESSAEGVRVSIETEIRVRLLGMTAYRYRHESREDWRRGDDGMRLLELHSRTDDDGKEFAVEGAAGDGVFLIDGSAGSLTAPPEVVPASYWTPLVLHRDELLSTKRGTLYPVSIERLGIETIESAGEEIEAERFLIEGDPAVNLWFDDRQRVRRLAFETRGEFIDYRLRELDRQRLNGRIF